MQQEFVPTRRAALRSLESATPELGTYYTTYHGVDAGPSARFTTSRLSPYLRRRMLTEQEVVAAAVAAHGLDGAGTFVQQVFRHSYLKGHLETRPAFWAQYRRLAREGFLTLLDDDGKRRLYEDAVTGRTGIDAFDHWARELTETGWLHGQARQWFASIWIFTLRLPWPLGAAFFMQHLLDGDPASNTLSWREVAGLHTMGKHFVARAHVITSFTNGRFTPAGLDEAPAPLWEAERPVPVPLPQADPLPEGDVALLLHGEDLHFESLPLEGMRVRRVGGLVTHPAGASAFVRKVNEDALFEALRRAAAQFQCVAGPMEAGWNDGLPVVTPYAPAGPTALALPRVPRLRRRWDTLVWPRSVRGYNQVKAAIPSVLREVGVLAR